MTVGWDAVLTIARADGQLLRAIDRYWHESPDLWVDKLYDGWYGELE